MRLLALLALLVATGLAGGAQAANLSLPLRATFYYPWYEGNWFDKPGCDLNVPFTCASPQMPLAGYYNQGYRKARWDIDNMQRAKIRVAISSWHGPGSRTDAAVADLLRAALDDGQGFQVTLYYELEGAPSGASDPSVSKLQSDLAYIASRYASHPNYLRVGGRPVIFVWTNGGDCEDMSRWSAAGAFTSWYVNPQVFGGYKTCSKQPASWHQYGFGPLGSGTGDRQPGYSFTVGPGFWHFNSPTPATTRNLPRFCSTVRAMVASGEPWQLVTSYNEHGEGTGIEPAVDPLVGYWGYAYIDALGRDGQGC